MSVRDTLLPLIRDVRSIITDTDPSEPAFSDEEIQRALDRRRRDVRYLQLCGVETLAPGQVLWLDFYAEGYPHWEEDAFVVNSSWATLTADTIDHAAGKWTFLATQRPPLYVTGKAFDLYAACADLLEQWATNVALCIDIDVAGQKFALSQKQKQLLVAAENCRRKALPSFARAVRTDAY